MTDQERVRVYGYGRSGQAYTARLRDRGHAVAAYDRVDGAVTLVDGERERSALLAVLAVPHGEDVADALAAIDPDEVPVIVDLTTQSPALTRRNAEAWHEKGGRGYHGGGSNGGERAIRAGSSFLLIGPRCDPPVWRVLRDIGHVTEYETAEYAVTLKLCHNAFLVVENELARQLALLCSRLGVDREDLEKVIDDGPAGRRFGDLTALRHLKGGYETSYAGQYAAKDWRHFQELLGPLDDTAFAFVDAVELERRLESRGAGPWV
ncbi:hypothetical protein [Streptomyces sp. NPDC014685]|uniref:hypothetical protein n=1 Tax=Streptomyces sp. NPDC014685 TaxID=3364881 RepID=UPI003702C205